MRNDNDDDDDDVGISGQDRLELQINAGVRPILEDVDALRILLGSDNVKCPTPRAETRLRCGEVALIPLQLVCTVIISNTTNFDDDDNDNNNNSNSIIITLTLIFPKTGYPYDLPLDVMITYDNNVDTDTITTENDEILDVLKDYCKHKGDNDHYPRAREVLEKMKQLLYSEYSNKNNDNIDNENNDNNDDNDNDDNIYATCMVCRMQLFDIIDVEKHDPSNKGFKRSSIPATSCTSYFLKDPMDWMTGLTENTGKILCPNPKCSSKLGQWCWTGSQCSCGLWITPAIQINKNKIDMKTDNSTIFNVR